MKHRIIWRRQGSADSKKLFTLQKKIIRIMMGVKSLNYFRDLFKRLQTLTFPYEYIYINFITNNKELFLMNVDVHSVNTRHKHGLHKPTANLSCLWKSIYYAGIKIFSNLQSDLKCLKVATHVTASLTSLHDQSFCTRMHKIPSPPHGTSTLEYTPVCTWNMSSSDDDALEFGCFCPYVQEKTAKEETWCVV
jgi:hypothetical protein